MNPEELEQHLIAQLNALPTTENRLLYDLDYDKALVIETAKQLLAHNPFPLLPRLDAHRLTILAAFASAMADDEYAELDSFYNRLSDIFFANAPLDVNRQDEIRDFVEETCKRYRLRFLRNQNRLVRNTIWLHGGLPSRHWESFFERVLMRVEESLENLDTLLNQPTPKTIKRFFDLCGNSARTFLRDCIDMREALLQPDANTYSAEDFGVSHLFFNAFKQYLQNNPPQRREQRSTLFFDERRLRVIKLPQGNEIEPTQNWYAFRTNGKYLSRCKSELPKATIIFICKNGFHIEEEVPRPIETEHLFGNWNGYRCEWLNLENQQALTLTRGNDEFRIDVISTPSVSLDGKKLMLNHRAVWVKHQEEEIEVHTTLPELVIENVSDSYLSKIRHIYINGEQKSINLTKRTSLAQLNLPEGIYTLHLRGARGLDPIQFAYLPNLNMQLDKNEYRANESPTLSIKGEKPCLLSHNTPRATIKYKSYRLSIPVPLFGWQMTDEAFTSEPISIAANKLPIRQGEKYLTVYFGNRHETHATLHLKRGGEILQRKTLPISDGYLKLDLASYRDIANANPELDFIFTIGNDVIPVLRTFKEWEPNITQNIDSRTVTLTIQDNAEGFRSREMIFWNLCRLWEKPTVVPLPDGASKITHTFEHEGEYGIQARIKSSGWGSAKELTPFDVPPSFNTQFPIGNTTLEQFLRQREDELRRVLLNNQDIPVREQEFIAMLAYLLKRDEQERAKRWIQLFLALPEAIHNRFQAALYSETHPAVQAVRHIYEQMIRNILNGQAYVTQFALANPIQVEFRAWRYQQDGLDGFMLRWNTNADSIRIIGIQNPNNLQPQAQRFVNTGALRFYTLIARQGDSTAIATVAVAREPLIVCFQAVQIDNTRFRLIWKVLQADEVELSTQGQNERVPPSGMKEVQPKHGQEFTLTAIAQGKDVPHKTIRTEFAKPYIQQFEATEIGDETVTLRWETLRADSVRIEPNIGEVAPSGEIEITKQQLATGVRLLATNKGDTEEKELVIDFDEMPFWFQTGEFVKIERNEKTFYAKVSNLLLGRTGQLTFAQMRTVDFTILYSKANRVHVRLNSDAMPVSVLELSSCRMPEPLSNLDDLINSLR